MKKMTMAQYERSSMDKSADKANAKKARMSVKKWEGSKGDEKADRAALKKLNAGKSPGVRSTTKNGKY